MSTKRLHTKSTYTEFSDDDDDDELVSSLFTDDDDDVESTRSSMSRSGSKELPRAIFIAAIAVVLLVLSLMAIAWKTKEGQQQESPVITDKMLMPDLRTIRASKSMNGSMKVSKSSALPRTKQLLLPGKRAFAGEPTTEYSMMEIADVNFESMRSRTSLTLVTLRPLTEQHGPPRVQLFTGRWRSAVGRKDGNGTRPRLPAGTPSKKPYSSSTLSNFNLVRRFVGRRRLPPTSTSRTSTSLTTTSSLDTTERPTTTEESTTTTKSSRTSKATTVPVTDEVTSETSSKKQYKEVLKYDEILPSSTPTEEREEVEIIPFAPITEETQIPTQCSVSTASTSTAATSIASTSTSRGSSTSTEESSSSMPATTAKSSTATQTTTETSTRSSVAADTTTRPKATKIQVQNDGVGRVVPIFDWDNEADEARTSTKSQSQTTFSNFVGRPGQLEVLTEEVTIVGSTVTQSPGRAVSSSKALAATLTTFVYSALAATTAASTLSVQTQRTGSVFGADSLETGTKSTSSKTRNDSSMPPFVHSEMSTVSRPVNTNATLASGSTDLHTPSTDDNTSSRPGTMYEEKQKTVPQHDHIGPPKGSTDDFIEVSDGLPSSNRSTDSERTTTRRDSSTFLVSITETRSSTSSTEIKLLSSVSRDGGETEIISSSEGRSSLDKSLPPHIFDSEDNSRKPNIPSISTTSSPSDLTRSAPDAIKHMSTSAVQVPEATAGRTTEGSHPTFGDSSARTTENKLSATTIVTSQSSSSSGSNRVSTRNTLSRTNRSEVFTSPLPKASLATPSSSTTITASVTGISRRRLKDETVNTLPVQKSTMLPLAKKGLLFQHNETGKSPVPVRSSTTVEGREESEDVASESSTLSATQTRTDTSPVMAGADELTSKSLSQSTAESVAKNVSKITSQSTAEGTTETATESTLTSSAESTSQSTSEGTSEGISESTSVGAPEGTSESTSETTTEQAASKGTTEGTTEKNTTTLTSLLVLSVTEHGGRSRSRGGLGKHHRRISKHGHFHRSPRKHTLVPRVQRNMTGTGHRRDSLGRENEREHGQPVRDIRRRWRNKGFKPISPESNILSKERWGKPRTSLTVPWMSDALKKTGLPSSNGLTERPSTSTGTEGGSSAEHVYERKVMPVEITHTHSSVSDTTTLAPYITTRTETGEEGHYTTSPLQPAAVVQNATMNEFMVDSDWEMPLGENGSEFSSGKYQHAAAWPRSKDASRLQKEHPHHSHKERAQKRLTRWRPPTTSTAKSRQVTSSAKSRQVTSSAKSRQVTSSASSSVTASTNVANHTSPLSYTATTTVSPSVVSNVTEATSAAASEAGEQSTFVMNTTTIVSKMTETLRSSSEATNGTSVPEQETLTNGTGLYFNVTAADNTTVSGTSSENATITKQSSWTTSTLSMATKSSSLTPSTRRKLRHLKYKNMSTFEMTTTARTTPRSLERVTLIHANETAGAALCSTVDCKEEGGRLQIYVDWSRNPCDSFYDYSCGGWIRHHPFPSSRKKLSVDDLIVELVEQKTTEYIYENLGEHTTYTDPLLHNTIKLFQGCSDKSSLLKNPTMALQGALDEVRLTDWPYDEEPMDIELPEVLALAARKLGVHPLFRISLEVDVTTPSSMTFVMRTPGTVVPADIYLASDFTATYQKLVTKAMSFVNSDKNVQALSEPVLEVDREIYRVVEKNCRMTDYTVEYHRKSLADVDKRREFDVVMFLNTLMDGIAVLDLDTEFITTSSTFLQEVQNITQAFDKSVLLNYIGFRAVLSLSPLLPHTEGRELAHLLYLREIPTRTPPKRWKFCIRMLENVYQLPLMQLQLDALKPDGAVEHLNRTVELVKKHFYRSIRNSSRFGSETKDLVINKLRMLKLESFSSPHIRDLEVREQHYHGVPDVDPANVLADYTSTLAVVLENYWSAYSSTNKRFMWHGSIFDTVSTYDHFDNTLYVPLTIYMENVKYNTFQSPLFFPRSARRIMEALYGMLEREGSFFGRQNEVVKSSSWDYISTDGFLSVRRCLKEQFRKAVVPHLSGGLLYTPSPSQTLRQDVKDNTVVFVIQEAFKEVMLDYGYKSGVFSMPGFTETSIDQLFFLLHATSLCEVTTQESLISDEVAGSAHPRKYRVNFALQNNRNFARAFHCPAGSEMNPPRKCRSW